MTAPAGNGGTLAENVVHFVQALRRAGIPAGPAQTEDALRAIAAAGFTSREDFRHLLRACLIRRAEHVEVFDRVFELFWRDPDFLERAMHMLAPPAPGTPDPERRNAGDRRAQEALGGARDTPQRERQGEEVTVDAAFTWAADERLRAMDFEQMSTAEMAEAARAVASLRLALPALPARRHAPSPRGRAPDMRATLRAALRRGGEAERLMRRAPRSRPTDIVALVDISGSMSAYSRMLLHFLHALSRARGAEWGHVHAFTFGTRLTNVTRALEARDADAALAAAGRDARDWQGGTRIGAALHRFNRDWSRRVLSRGAVVLLVTDGLERGDPELLAAEAARLARSCRALIWLNPLLRWEGFAPEARGVRALMPAADRFLACHSLDSLAALAELLSAPGSMRKTVAPPRKAVNV